MTRTLRRETQDRPKLEKEFGASGSQLDYAAQDCANYFKGGGGVQTATPPEPRVEGEREQTHPSGIFFELKPFL